MRFIPTVFTGVFMLGSMNPVYATEESITRYVNQVIENYDVSGLSPATPDSSGRLMDRMGNWVDSSELRLTGDSDADQKRSVALHLSLKNATQLEVEQNLIQLQVQKQLLERQKMLSQVLQNAYLQLLELVTQEEIISHLERQKELVSIELDYYRGQVESTDFQPDNLLGSELDLDQIDALLSLHRQQVSALRQYMRFDADVELSGLSVQEMLSQVNAWMSYKPVNLKLAQLELLQTKFDLKSEQSRHDLVLSAIQFKTDFAQDEKPIWGVRLDVQLPFSGTSMKETVTQQNINTLTFEINHLHQQKVFDGTQWAQKLQRNLLQLSAAEKQVAEMDLRLQSTSSSGLILRLRKQRLRQQEKIMQITQDSREDYINFLAQFSLLALPTDNNWLYPQAIMMPAVREVL